MAINMTDPPTLPDLGDPSTFNSRALALFSWVKDTFIPELEAIDGPDLGGAVQTQGDVLDDLNALGVVTGDGYFLVGTGSGSFAWENGETARTSLGAQAQGDVLDDLNALGVVTGDGDFLVGTGSGTFAWESGATVRDSLGLGTSDNPQFAGIYLGGAASANLLDDYESGTWSPIFDATGSGMTISYATQDGFYTKIGREVRAKGRIVLSSKSGGTGDLVISNLPFVPATGSIGVMNVGYSASFSNGLNGGMIYNNNSFVSLYRYSSTSAQSDLSAPVTTADLGGTADVFFDIIYETDG